MGREYIVAVAKRIQGETDIRRLDFKVIRNGMNYWVADPFPIEVDGELYIFGEIFEYSKLKGSLGYTKLVDGKFTSWKKVIEEDYHMSFPNLFYEKQSLYMCPEACGSKTLYLYKCKKFPDVWIKDKVLATNVNYSDTVIYEKNNEKYIFTCVWESPEKHSFVMGRVTKDGIQESNGTMETLDFYLTRPAGKIFTSKDTEKQIMVSQICKPLYGSGLVIKKFDVSWPDYSEKEICRLYPKDVKCNLKKKYVGMHTLNYSENYVVIDLIWDRFSPVEKFFRGLRKIKKKVG